MCGFVGQVGELSDRIRQARAIQTLFHCGPDAHDNWQADTDDAWFAQRRLAIVDLSEACHQPMYNNEDHMLWLDCNGEIYNNSSLRHRLEFFDHTFYTNCDFESILHSFKEWGEDCVNYLESMFAFGYGIRDNGNCLWRVIGSG